MQSGTRKTRKWVIEFPPLDRADPNHLMGWAQSRDTVKQMKLEFETLDAAKSYAESKGYSFEIVDPAERTPKSKSYSDNFKFNKIS